MGAQSVSHTAHIRSSKDNLWLSVLFLRCTGPRDQAQFIRLSKEHFAFCLRLINLSIQTSASAAVLRDPGIFRTWSLLEEVLGYSLRASLSSPKLLCALVATEPFTTQGFPGGRNPCSL